MEKDDKPANLPAIYDAGLAGETDGHIDDDDIDVVGIINSEAFKEAMEEGNMAATRLRSRAKSMFTDWLALGHSLYYLHVTAMQITGANSVSDGHYRAKLDALLSHTAFSQVLDKYGRSRLIWLIEREEAVMTWWNTLSAEQQLKWTHPSTIHKEFNRKDKPKKPKHEKRPEEDMDDSDELDEVLGGGGNKVKITTDAKANVAAIVAAVDQLVLTEKERAKLLKDMAIGLQNAI